MEQPRKLVLYNRLVENHKNAVDRKNALLALLEPINNELDKNYNKYLNYGIKRDEYNSQIEEYNNMITEIQRMKVQTKTKLDKEPKIHADIVEKENKVLENELARIEEKVVDAKCEWCQTKAAALCDKELHIKQLDSINENLCNIEASMKVIMDARRNSRYANKESLLAHTKIKSEIAERIKDIDARIAKTQEVIDNNTTKVDIVSGETINPTPNLRVLATANKQLNALNNLRSRLINETQTRLYDSVASFRDSEYKSNIENYKKHQSDIANHKVYIEATTQKICDIDELVANEPNILQCHINNFAADRERAHQRHNIMMTRADNNLRTNIAKFKQDLLDADANIIQYKDNIIAIKQKIADLEKNNIAIANMVKSKENYDVELQKIQKYIADLEIHLNSYGSV
jgi:hypothetical protein